jgi:hypothetical protein
MQWQHTIKGTYEILSEIIVHKYAIGQMYQYNTHTTTNKYKFKFI